MSMNKKHLVAAAFVTLALIMGSYRATADCETRTGIRCWSDKMCLTICVQMKCGFSDGYCSLFRCVCARHYRTVVWGEADDGEEGQAGHGGAGMLN